MFTRERSESECNYYFGKLGTLLRKAAECAIFPVCDFPLMGNVQSLHQMLACLENPILKQHLKTKEAEPLCSQQEDSDIDKSNW